VVCSRTGKTLKDFAREVVVEVAKGDYVFVPAVAQVALAHSANTDSSDAELVAWSLISGASEHMTGNDDWSGKTGSKQAAPGYSAACAIAGILRPVRADCFIRWHFKRLLFQPVDADYYSYMCFRRVHYIRCPLLNKAFIKRFLLCIFSVNSRQWGC
jgi:hypothetical protein